LHDSSFDSVVSEQKDNARLLHAWLLCSKDVLLTC